MTIADHDPRVDPRIAVAEVAGAQSAKSDQTDRFFAGVARAATVLGWAAEKSNPLGRLIPPGARVLIKPNMVLDENQGPWGLEPLITDPSLIKAAVKAALQSDAAEVLVGDAPIQGCDFTRLLELTGLDAWADDLKAAEPRFKGIRDFRRTTCKFVNGVRVKEEDLQPEELFLLFDLAANSLLEPISDHEEAFRVTCYDPRLLAQTHSRGRHRYLVARDVLDADVIVNLPKLKTHKKAGITCALKNLIGINGNKEYLPHHRLGGADTGGDCYPGGSQVKRALEYVSDRQNTTQWLTMGRVWRGFGTQLNRVLHLTGDHLGIEGSWIGNDTIWRTALDLNRILVYGTNQGTMADIPQRRVVHIVDAVIAGQGDGPLAPQRLPLGLILAGSNAAAVDWVGSQLLGYDPQRVSIVREAFGAFKWPLTSFPHEEVSLVGDWGSGQSAQIISARNSLATPVIHPAGWVGASALQSRRRETGDGSKPGARRRQVAELQE